MSWGFRLQGGVDFNTPLSVQVVQPKSVAERCGLRAGDGIISINNTNTDSLTHEQAKMEIIRSCNDIQLTVIRGAVQIWKPKVTPMSDLRPTEMQPIQTATGDQMYTSQKTSLAKDRPDETCTIGSAYNRSAKPFSSGGFGVDVSNIPTYGSPAFQQQQSPPPQQYQAHPQYPPPQQRYQQQEPQSPKKAVPNVVHAQFNSPIGLYSPNNIAKAYSDQTTGIEHSMENVDVSDAPVGLRMTGTFQKLDGSGPSFGTSFDSPASPTSPGDEGTNVVSTATNPSQSTVAPESSQSEVFTNGHETSVETNEANKTSGPSGFRSVSAPKPGSAPAAPPKQESMHCNGCGNMVTGVFVRVKGLPYHEKCFTCFNCGLHLKQKGYFMIDGNLYCEVHARRVAEPPGDNYRAAGAVYR